MALLKISDATSLALHAMVLLASEPQRVFTTHDIASTLQASEAHLSKVLQRLHHDRLVKSVRGPKGGYILGKPAHDITLLHVYEIMEGRFDPEHCLLDKPLCDGTKCILGGLICHLNSSVLDYFKKTRLSRLTKVFNTEGVPAWHNET